VDTLQKETEVGERKFFDTAPRPVYIKRDLQKVTSRIVDNTSPNGSSATNSRFKFA